MSTASRISPRPAERQRVVSIWLPWAGEMTEKSSAVRDRGRERALISAARRIAESAVNSPVMTGSTGSLRV